MLKNKTIKVTAHAKVNLTLHVVGQRANGYHDLQSLVCLTEFGDQIHLSLCLNLDFTLQGHMPLVFQWMIAIWLFRRLSSWRTNIPGH